MSYTCPHCGGVIPGEETCQQRFDHSQILELEQPGFYAVHHLSVPCYLLQHNRYSRRGWLEVRKLLEKIISKGWTAEMALRESRYLSIRGNKDWSLTKGEKLPGVEQIQWQLTIADVKLDSAETYCADVRRWAETILIDSQHLA
jgi:hypothetical protein